jgi:putative glutamine amidotransferase
MKGKPKIGITMRLDIEKNRFYLGRDYSEALAYLGAIPIHLSLIPSKEYIWEILNFLDGILLPGSDSDIDPVIYGKEPVPKLKTVVPIKDETDLLVLNQAEKLMMPVLGICFGMQALNVSRGGTLIQDIETQVLNCLKHEQGFPRDRNSHSINIEENSLLSGLAPSNCTKVNSHHHQSIEQVGNNLKATAWAKDSVIECIEDVRDDRFAFGVQWHAELNYRVDNLSKKIFQSFVSACSEFESRGK